MSTEDRAIAAAAMELNCRAGYQPGHGYVHAVEAADEILDEALEPFVRNLERRATIGMTSAATELHVTLPHEELPDLCPNGTASWTDKVCSSTARRLSRKPSRSADEAWRHSARSPRSG